MDLAIVGLPFSGKTTVFKALMAGHGSASAAGRGEAIGSVKIPDERLQSLGGLVAAKYARELNTLPRESMPLGEEKKLTTRALEALTSGQIEFRLVKRRQGEGLPTTS